MTKNTPPKAEEPLLLTVVKAAERLGITPLAMKAMCVDGRMPSTRIANRTMIPATALIEFVESIQAAS